MGDGYLFIVEMNFKRIATTINVMGQVHAVCEGKLAWRCTCYNYPVIRNLRRRVGAIHVHNIKAP
jgi:hypothetical protein